MQWWNDFVDWIYSSDGWRFISTAVIPFVAIVVAGLIAALIGRGTARRVIAMADRERRIATVTALISAARRASRWNTLSAPEQQHAEHLMHEADTRVRLLALPGSSMVADWSAHEINQMKSNSVSFSFQAEQSLIDFRNRLVEWQARPGRAKKLFKNDLDTWAYESSVADQDLVSKQKEWAKRQVNETGPISTITAASTTAAPAAPLPFSSPAPLAAATVTPEAPAPREPVDVPTQAYEPPTVDGENREDSGTGSTPTGTPSASATTPAGSSIDEGRRSPVPPATIDLDAAPGPVSAGRVRQRINPDTPDY